MADNRIWCGHASATLVQSLIDTQATRSTCIQLDPSSSGLIACNIQSLRHLLHKHGGRYVTNRPYHEGDMRVGACHILDWRSLSKNWQDGYIMQWPDCMQSSEIWKREHEAKEFIRRPDHRVWWGHESGTCDRRPWVFGGRFWCPLLEGPMSPHHSPHLLNWPTQTPLAQPLHTPFATSSYQSLPLDLIVWFRFRCLVQIQNLV